MNEKVRGRGYENIKKGVLQFCGVGGRKSVFGDPFTAGAVIILEIGCSLGGIVFFADGGIAVDGVPATV